MNLVQKLFKFSKNPLLGRWNSILYIGITKNHNRQDIWEKYLDMANMDNCCCSYKAHTYTALHKKNKN